MRFEGWIPNATGNMSFSAIGDALEGGVLVREQCWSPNTRWIICSQRRSNPDRLLPQPILAFLHTRRNAGSGRQKSYDSLVYTLSARSVAIRDDDEGAIEGRISISLPGDATIQVLDIAKALARGLAAAKAAWRSGAKHNAPTLQEWQSNTDKISNLSIFSSNFKMLRNGKCFLDTISVPVDAEISKWLVSQCYYYLKDTVHQHYHHQTRTDAIIELTPYGAHPGWRLRTLRGLYRKVISLRRNQNDEMLSNALGVLAYARVFSGLFGECDYNAAGQKRVAKKLPLYSDDLSTSIDLRRQAAQRSSDLRKTQAQFGIASVLAVVALYVSLYSSFSHASSAYKIGNWLISVIGDHPLIALVPIVITFTVYTLYTGQYDIGKIRAVRWFYRVFAWLGKWSFVLITGGLGVLVGLLAAWLILEALTPPSERFREVVEAYQTIARIISYGFSKQ